MEHDFNQSIYVFKLTKINYFPYRFNDQVR